MGAPAARDRKPGDVVAGRFRLVAKLGQGTMGSVWSADHLTLRVPVAVKFMDGQAMVSDRTALLRFEQEARAAASIKSPHVVSILDYGKDSAGNPYLAMEQLGGMSLEARLASGRLSIPETRDVIVQACRGLERAHAAGIIHRDIKPDNIFLSKEGDGVVAKILDFGIAKSFGGNVSIHLTGTGQMLGTPIFMSPEQALGQEQIDSRTDLYSLGVVAFNCLTGHLPFEESKTVGELVVAIAMRAPPPITKWRKDLPPAVIAWFERVLQKDPGARFQTAREMAAAFDEACAARKMMVTFNELDVDESGPRRDLAPPGDIAASLEAPRKVRIEEQGARGSWSGPDKTERRSRPPPAPGPSVAILVLGGLVILMIGIVIGLAIARYRL